LVYYRSYKMPAASKALTAQKKKSHVTGYDVASLKLLLQHFGPRLFATCATWFMNDIFFYGNKLFQSQFISVISGASGNDSVMVNWLWNLVNIAVSLCGYYMAAFLIDNKFVGRNRMMQLGFFMDFLMFVIPCFRYKYYSKDGIHALMAMYFLSSFFNQFGPNCVTFLIAAEVYPTSVRATAHGLSAATGKLGALVASVVYNYITIQQKFYFVPWFGLAGMIITFLFMPDTTGLDLKEQERRWQFIREGREHEYHGIAINPRHLSWYEIWTGVGKNYNPELDHQQKVDEMRRDWVERQQAKYGEEDLTAFEDEYTDEVHSYFLRTTPSLKSGKPAAQDEKLSGEDSDKSM